MIESLVRTPLVRPNQKSSYAAGTAYALTNTAAQTVFGTTSPEITLNQPGTYRIKYRAQVKYNAATFAASRTVTTKLRRTNNTAADVSNSSVSALTDIITALTYQFTEINKELYYTTTNSDDILQLWGSIDVVPSAGSIDVVDAEITAERIS